MVGLIHESTLLGGRVGLIHSLNLILFLLPLIAYAVSKARRF